MSALTLVTGKRCCPFVTVIGAFTTIDCSRDGANAGRLAHFRDCGGLFVTGHGSVYFRRGMSGGLEVLRDCCAQALRSALRWQHSTFSGFLLGKRRNSLLQRPVASCRLAVMPSGRGLARGERGAARRKREGKSYFHQLIRTSCASLRRGTTRRHRQAVEYPCWLSLGSLPSPGTACRRCG